VRCKWARGFRELLLEKGASIEAQDKYGQTPLWRAAANTRLLLERAPITVARIGMDGRHCDAVSQTGTESSLGYFVKRSQK